MWGPQDIKVGEHNSNNYGLWYANNKSYWGESKPTYNWGASHCRDSNRTFRLKMDPTWREKQLMKLVETWWSLSVLTRSSYYTLQWPWWPRFFACCFHQFMDQEYGRNSALCCCSSYQNTRELEIMAMAGYGYVNIPRCLIHSVVSGFSVEFLISWFSAGLKTYSSLETGWWSQLTNQLQRGWFCQFCPCFFLMFATWSWAWPKKVSTTAFWPIRTCLNLSCLAIQPTRHWGYQDNASKKTCSWPSCHSCPSSLHFMFHCCFEKPPWILNGSRWWGFYARIYFKHQKSPSFSWANLIYFRFQICFFPAKAPEVSVNHSKSPPDGASSPPVIELDDGKIYRKALYLMVKTMVSCRFSQQNQSRYHQELEQKRRDDFEKKQMDDMVREERLMAEAARRASAASPRSTHPAMLFEKCWCRWRKWSMFWY